MKELFEKMSMHMYVPRRCAGTRMIFVMIQARIGKITYITTPARNSFRTIPVSSCDTVDRLFRIIHGQVICTIILESFAFTSLVRMFFLKQVKTNQHCNQ